MLGVQTLQRGSFGCGGNIRQQGKISILIKYCMQLICNNSHIPVQMGFFADAGPLQIFVSQHLIPSHYRVEITDDAAFESEENSPPIKAGAFVRVRIVGLKAEANQLVCTNDCLPC